jgi:hypothetical protein
MDAAFVFVAPVSRWTGSFVQLVIVPLFVEREERFPRGCVLSENLLSRRDPEYGFIPGTPVGRVPHRVTVEKLLASLVVHLVPEGGRCIEDTHQQLSILLGSWADLEAIGALHRS